MKYRLMDLLACPICKNFPLELIVFSEGPIKGKFSWSRCEEYCGFEGKRIEEITEFKCDDCFKREIKEGILICNKCGRWYPIIDEIPHMLPDGLREKEEDLGFLRKYRDRIPERVLTRGKPFNLSSA
ncbi:MAG: Trm112 family protein [Thaumarchaeota archaeon]|nr:MAG: Trm112 family protein [Nitrososphaerota archaeon]